MDTPNDSNCISPSTTVNVVVPAPAPKAKKKKKSKTQLPKRKDAWFRKVKLGKGGGWWCYSKVIAPTGKPDEPITRDDGSRLYGIECELEARTIASRVKLTVGLNQSGNATLEVVFQNYLRSLTNPTTRTRGEQIWKDLKQHIDPSTPASKITEDMVLEWLDRPSWGANNRIKNQASLMAALNLACTSKPKLLDKNPLQGMKRVAKAETRIFFINEIQTEAVFHDCEVMGDRWFGRFLRFLAHTGCRPGECAKIQASDCHQDDDGLYKVVLSEHKTSKKTGKTRIIICDKVASELIAGLVKQHQTGPLFRTRRNAPWKMSLWSDYFNRMRGRIEARGISMTYFDAKSNKTHDLSCYAFRHSFAKNLISRGATIEQVSALLSHEDIATTYKYYAQSTVEESKALLLRLTA